MIYPPDPIDPNKPWQKELVRYAVGMWRYQRAIDEGYNDHGPWEEEPRVPLIPAPKISHIKPRNRIEAERLGDIAETYLREGAF